MKIQINILIVLLILISFSCSDDEPGTAPTTLEGKLDQYLEQNQLDSEPGMSIVVRKDGQIVYQGNKGIARVDADLSINSDTQFRLASVSKPITALAIMKLIEDGDLSLDDKLLDFYPELPKSFEGITIEQLITHQAGLLDYIDDNTNIMSLDNLTTPEVLALIGDSGLGNLMFQPGTRGEYSNTGYVFLALIVEKVTNKSFPEYLDEFIFHPSGMTNSFVISENDHLGDHGENYALSFGTNLKVKGFNSLIYGASGVVSTTNDLVLFMEALLDYEIVSRETLELMTQTRATVVDIDSDYGLGWFTGTGNNWHTGYISSRNDFFHPGGFDGYETVLSFNPDQDIQLAILTNGGSVTQQKKWAIMNIVRNHF